MDFDETPDSGSFTEVLYRFGFGDQREMRVDVIFLVCQGEISEAEKVTAATEHAVAYGLRRNFAERLIEEAETFGTPTTWMELPNHEYVRLLRSKGYLYRSMLYERTGNNYKIWVD